MVRRVVAVADVDRAHHPHGTHSVRAEQREFAVDDYRSGDLCDWGCTAVSVYRCVVWVCAVAAGLLGVLGGHFDRVYGADAVCKDKIDSAVWIALKLSLASRASHFL